MPAAPRDPFVFLGGYFGVWAALLAVEHWTDGTLLTLWGLPVHVVYEAWSDVAFHFTAHR